MTDDLRSLIRRGRDLDSLIKESSEELKNIKARLIAAGAGKHEGTDGAQALVIFPAPSIKGDEETARAVRRLVGPTKYAKLFLESVVFTPVKAFREVASALLAPDVAEEAIKLCEREGSPQVRFS